MSGMNRLPSWLIGSLVGATFVALLIWERRHPLRRSIEPKLRHEARNRAVAGLSFASIQAAEMPVTLPLAKWIERNGWGLVKSAGLPLWLEIAVAVVLLDYTLYLWHILMHKVPILWRFHQPHHVDLDLDTSTAVRFHFAEMVISVPWRVAQIALIGVSPLALSIWQTATLIEVLFHHSNVRLPIGVERWLCRILVTPRMHGIHHSIVPEEQNSNWSSGLTVWDWLHGTLRLNVPQAEITIGVPAYLDPKQVTLPKVVAMPFKEQRPTWNLPGAGVPSRPPLSVPPKRLLP